MGSLKAYDSILRKGFRTFSGFYWFLLNQLNLQMKVLELVLARPAYLCCFYSRVKQLYFFYFPFLAFGAELGQFGLFLSFWRLLKCFYFFQGSFSFFNLPKEQALSILLAWFPVRYRRSYARSNFLYFNSCLVCSAYLEQPMLISFESETRLSAFILMSLVRRSIFQRASSQTWRLRITFSRSTASTTFSARRMAKQGLGGGRGQQYGYILTGCQFLFITFSNHIYQYQYNFIGTIAHSLSFYHF